jgi:hypothetical protein
VYLPGVENNVVINNRIWNHNSYGVLIGQSVDSDTPMNNTVMDNWIGNSDFDEDGYGYALGYDGNGGLNCWAGNDFEDATGPPDIETLYPCDPRTASGVPYGPVLAHVAMSASQGPTREEEEPPDPKRPRCQKGAPGCDR